MITELAHGPRARHPILDRFTAAWCLVAAVTVAITLTTLRLSPVAWQDEVQILDWGRMLMPGGDKTYGLNLVDANQPHLNVSYLGCIASELAYRVAGHDMAGPRLLALIGAIFASGAMLAYLRARGIQPWVCLAIATALLWDPLFAQGYRGARMDSWVMGLMILACCIVRSRSVSNPLSWRLQAACGLVVALAGLVWVSAVLLLPMLIAELLDERIRAGDRSLRGMVRSVSAVAAWTTCFGILLLSPFGTMAVEMVQSTVMQADGAVSQGGYGTSRIMGLLGPFRFSPVLPLLGLILLVHRRQWLLGSALAAGTILVLATGPYGHRDVYLEPYLLTSVAVGAASLESLPSSWARRLTLVCVAGLALFGLAVTLVARSVNALKTADERDPRAIEAVLRETIGASGGRAYTQVWGAYYGLRALDWEPCRVVFARSPGATERVLAQCRVGVFSATKDLPLTAEELSRLGFVELADLKLPPLPETSRFRIFVRTEGSSGSEAPSAIKASDA